MSQNNLWGLLIPKWTFIFLNSVWLKRYSKNKSRKKGLFHLLTARWRYRALHVLLFSRRPSRFLIVTSSCHIFLIRPSWEKRKSISESGAPKDYFETWDNIPFKQRCQFGGRRTEDFLCDICSDSFAYSSALFTHKRLKHKNELSTSGWVENIVKFRCF